MISVLDLGLGNSLAVMRMVQRAGGQCSLAHSADDLRVDSRVVLPGVGAFDAGLQALRSRGLDDALKEIGRTGRGQILGLCLGMQLLLDGSDEGSDPGLGLIKGRAVRIPANMDTRVPHMGWNVVQVARPTAILQRLPPGPQFYFAHSFYANLDDPSLATLTVTHGLSFCAALESGPVLGAQFHPEKSHRFGLRFMEGFINR